MPKTLKQNRMYISDRNDDNLYLKLIILLPPFFFVPMMLQTLSWLGEDRLECVFGNKPLCNDLHSLMPVVSRKY